MAKVDNFKRLEEMLGYDPAKKTSSVLAQVKLEILEERDEQAKRDGVAY